MIKDLKNYEWSYFNDRSPELYHFVFRTPFNLNTPLGYLIAFTTLWIGAHYLLLIFSSSLSLFTGSCTILIALAEDIKVELWALEKANRNAKGQTEFKSSLYGYIQLYSSSKQYECTQNEKKIVHISMFKSLEFFQTSSTALWNLSTRNNGIFCVEHCNDLPVSSDISVRIGWVSGFFHFDFNSEFCFVFILSFKICNQI